MLPPAYDDERQSPQSKCSPGSSEEGRGASVWSSSGHPVLGLSPQVLNDHFYAIGVCSRLGSTNITDCSFD
jgi:hypothetical protein